MGRSNIMIDHTFRPPPVEPDVALFRNNPRLTVVCCEWERGRGEGASGAYVRSRVTRKPGPARYIGAVTSMLPPPVTGEFRVSSVFFYFAARNLFSRRNTRYGTRSTGIIKTLCAGRRKTKKRRKFRAKRIRVCARTRARFP